MLQVGQLRSAGGSAACVVQGVGGRAVSWLSVEDGASGGVAMGLGELPGSFAGC